MKTMWFKGTINDWEKLTRERGITDRVSTESRGGTLHITHKELIGADWLETAKNVRDNDPKASPLFWVYLNTENSAKMIGVMYTE